LWVNNYNYLVFIKEIRVQLDLSQEDLARELGVSYATINRWENGRFLPSRLAAMQLEAYCDRMIGVGRLILPGYKK
jgi:putative transcriptional regulator